MRGVEIAKKDIHLKKFTEAYTSKNWIVRIYKLHSRQNRAPKFERNQTNQA
jgi:hypothetical protein